MLMGTIECSGAPVAGLIRRFANYSIEVVGGYESFFLIPKRN